MSEPWIFVKLRSRRDGIASVCVSPSYIRQVAIAQGITYDQAISLFISGHAENGVVMEVELR